MRDAGLPFRRVMAAFCAMAVIYFFSYFLRAGIPGTIFNEVQSELGLSASAVAALGSLFVFIYAWMQLFAGMAADRFGGTRTLVYGGIVMGIGATLFPLSQSLGMLYFTRALTGFGASFMYLSIVKEVDLLFAARRFPAVMGIVLACGYAGGVAAMLPFERLVATFGWRPTLFGIGVLILACLGVTHLLLRTMNHFRPRRTPLTFRPLWEIAANPRVRPLLVCSFINFSVYFVIQAAFGKKFLQDFAGLSSARAAAVTTVMMAVSATLVVTGGFAPAWLGHRRKPMLIASPLILLAASLMLLGGVLAGGPGWLFLAAYVLLAVPSGAGPAALATMKELSPPDRAALSIGVSNALSYVGVSVFMAAVGLILDGFGGSAAAAGGPVIYPRAAYAWVFAWLTFMALVSTVSACLVPETRGVNDGDLGA